MSERHWIIRGRVQRVNFRAAARHRAAELRLACRVWNRDDGAVECIAEGEPASLEELERWLAIGPKLARVDAVERVAG